MRRKCEEQESKKWREREKERKREREKERKREREKERKRKREKERKREREKERKVMMTMQTPTPSNKEIPKHEQWHLDGNDSFSSEYNSTTNNSNNKHYVPVGNNALA